MNSHDYRRGTLAEAGRELGYAFDQLNSALIVVLLPAFEAFANAIERAADAWRDSRPARWLNRRARRDAMRRHPAGQLGEIRVQLQADAGPFLDALDRVVPRRLDVAGSAVQTDAGPFPTPAEVAARAGIRLDAPAGDVEPPAPHPTHSMWYRQPDSGECEACGLCTCCDPIERAAAPCPEAFSRVR